MYANGPHTKVSRIANEALEAYRIVILNASDDTKVEYPAAQFASKQFGITLTAAEEGEQVDVVVDGITLLQVDGNAANIVPGDWIVTHNDLGYGQKIGSTAATVYEHIAVAFGGATADGAIIPVQIAKGTYTTPA